MDEDILSRNCEGILLKISCAIRWSKKIDGNLIAQLFLGVSWLLSKIFIVIEYLSKNFIYIDYKIMRISIEDYQCNGLNILKMKEDTI